MPHFPWSPKKASVAERNIRIREHNISHTVCRLVLHKLCNTQHRTISLPTGGWEGPNEMPTLLSWKHIHGLRLNHYNPLTCISNLHLPSANFIICQVIFIHTISPTIYKIYKNTHSLGVMKGPSIYHDVGNVFSAVSSIMPCIISAETWMLSLEENWQIWGH